LGRAFVGGHLAPGAELAGVRDPLSTVLHPHPSASVMSGVSLGSAPGPWRRLLLGSTMACQSCRLLAEVALWGGRLAKDLQGRCSYLHGVVGDLRAVPFVLSALNPYLRPWGQGYGLLGCRARPYQGRCVALAITNGGDRQGLLGLHTFATMLAISPWLVPVPLLKASPCTA
jgi:hypothetical protein